MGTGNGLQGQLAGGAIARRFTLEVPTEGENEIVDLTREINARVAAAIRELGTGAVGGTAGGAGGGQELIGLVHLFVVGSTAGLTTIEYEPGLIRHDFNAMLERIAPADGNYDHEATWNDDNGHSHLRASLVGPALTVPVGQGKLILGQWQQVVLCEFDTRPRRRQVVGTLQLWA